jgi:hypothetical protein
VAELVDAPPLGGGGQRPWGFESLHPHSPQVLHAVGAQIRLPAAMGTSSVVILHPNRDKPEAKATKAAVILLLVTSAAITAIITFGGWSRERPIRES